MSKEYSPKDIEKKWQDIWDKEEAKVLCIGRVSVSVRAGASRRASQTIHGDGYRVKKAQNAGLQCTVSDGVGRVWTPD